MEAATFDVDNRQIPSSWESTTLGGRVAERFGSSLGVDRKAVRSCLSAFVPPLPSTCGLTSRDRTSMSADDELDDGLLCLRV